MKESVIVERLDWTKLPIGTVVMGPVDRGHKQALLPDGTRLQTPESWGAESIEHAETIRDAVRGGIIPGSEGARTLASAAGSWLRRNMPEAQIWSVPTRFRDMFSFIKVGPMVSTVGSYKLAYHLDRRKAYLAGFYEPMPLCRTYTALSGDRAKRMLNAGLFTGTAHLSVRVPDTIGDVGPLPAMARLTKTSPKYNEVTITEDEVIWPVGCVVSGVWTDNLIYSALDMGCEIVDVYQAVTYEMEPWLSGLGDYIKGMVNGTCPVQSRTWKAVYQTGWLKFRGEAAWVEQEVIPSWRKVRLPDGNRGTIETTELRNRPVKPSRLLQNKIDPRQGVYRPDISQRIASTNVVEVTRMAAKYGCIAAHIDSLHTLSRPEPCDLSTEIGGWRIVEQGPASFFGVGEREYSADTSYTVTGDGNLWLRDGRHLASVECLDRPRWSLFDAAWSPSGWYEPADNEPMEET